ncbi:hypothetical protein HO173_005766 [Letharia columbiana]|uniref:CorA-like transporter domain-containing protein n=1 Tax=Letharia columbiana TaxID=112416 RepID=A0A8H6L5D0_9LECA|nr:uncharacterized protein HO173_005766 [Letharia columbiana]KAF6236137.1 hypothetical protein HO173_005766 [Letharia columbiana]
MISQTLEGRYVDKEKLVKLLKALFGVGNFSIKDVDDSFKLSAPRKLTQEIRDADVDVFIFLRQEYSWGRLLITEDTFGKILDSCNAFPEFNDHVSSFAFKTSDCDEHFATCDRRVNVSAQAGQDDHNCYELCYLLRYPARHGRKSGYPFSLRQTAVYQRFDDVRKTSKWIFVQAPDDFSNELRNSLSSGNQERSPRDIHRCAFALAEQEWRDYICYLDAELRVLEEKALFVDVDVYSECDYLVAFADSQKLQRLRRRLVKCKEVLDCCLEIALRCQTHWQDLCSRGMLESREDNTELGSYISRIKTHKRGIEAIQEHTEGIATLLSQILNYRNENMIVKSNEALNKNSDAMREIAIAAKADNELISVLIGKSQNDSHTVKVLTYIALIYLPASLVAEIFNSNLIQTTNGEPEAVGTHLVLSRSFWLYPSITLGLMVLTFVPIFGLLFNDRRLRRLPLKLLGNNKERD